MLAPNPIPMSEQPTVGRRESTSSGGALGKEKSLFQTWVPNCLCGQEVALNLKVVVAQFSMQTTFEGTSILVQYWS